MSVLSAQRAPGIARRGRSTILVALVASAALLLSGCQLAAPTSGSEVEETVQLTPLDELTPIADPTSYEGPSTALIGGPSLPPIADAPEQQLPTTVISHDREGDIEVTVEDASRLLALSLTGTLAELVDAYGLAGSLVGRDISTKVRGHEDLPVVTKDGHSVDIEGVMALSPTLILTDGSLGTEMVALFRDAGVPVVMVSRAQDPESTYELAREVASALGVAPLADALIEQLQQAIAEKEAQIQALLPEDPALRPRIAFLYVRGSAGIYYLFGEGSGIDSMIDSLGAIDVAEEIGWVGEKPLTNEALVALNPDIILVMTKGLESAGGVDGLIEAQPSIALTTAGKNRRIVDVEDTLIFAGGTRIPDVLDGLARAIYAPNSL